MGKTLKQTVFDGGNHSATDATMNIYPGDLRAVKSDIIKARPIGIFEIAPDPTQPRRAVPSAVRGHLSSDVSRLFADWESLAQAESADQVLFVNERLASQAISGEYQFGPMATALLELVTLAASIRRDGLTNPITIAQTEDGYQLETGERRWLAYHLLYDRTNGDSQWSQIPARIVERVDRFRQAAENTQRGDLTAVAKVRQYALLLMELRKGAGDTFAPYESFEHDRDFYAQVAGRAAPDGKNEVLLSACGIRTKSTASKYRDVLSLTPQQWTLADDEGLSFDAIKGRFAVTNSPSVKREKTSAAATHISLLKKMQKASGKYAPHEREQLKQTLREWLKALG